MSKARKTMRAARRESSLPSVVLAGYTNSGKSSLLNRMTGSGVLVEDALFATLDPTVRRARTPDGREFTIADTVGFVRHLPHQLVEAFRSTLEEVTEADLVLHVVDASAGRPEDQISAVREVLAEIGAAKVPELLVANKVDIADPMVVARLAAQEPHLVVVSARTGLGITDLFEVLGTELPQPEVAVDVTVPFSAGGLVSRVHSEGTQVEVEYHDNGARVKGLVSAELAAALEESGSDVAAVPQASRDTPAP
jgi:GTP-binding protein HflX